VALASRRDEGKINGKMRYLWRTVDHEGEISRPNATETRHKAAALKFLKRAMKC
jgi:putative transposase